MPKIYDGAKKNTAKKDSHDFRRAMEKGHMQPRKCAAVTARKNAKRNNFKFGIANVGTLKRKNGISKLSITAV